MSLKLHIVRALGFYAVVCMYAHTRLHNHVSMSSPHFHPDTHAHARTHTQTCMMSEYKMFTQEWTCICKRSYDNIMLAILLHTADLIYKYRHMYSTTPTHINTRKSSNLPLPAAVAPTNSSLPLPAAPVHTETRDQGIDVLKDFQVHWDLRICAERMIPAWHTMKASKCHVESSVKNSANCHYSHIHTNARQYPHFLCANPYACKRINSY